MHIFVATVLSIALLLGNSVKLRASVTGPVASDGDGPASHVCACQTCCQGTAAIPGVPGQHGLPGSKGDAGQPGQNGDIGPIGPMGQRGASGDAGPKGDDGIGQPGKIGPRGPPGVVGSPGQTGVKGQKGEPGGASDESTSQQVAFTVTRTSFSHLSSDFLARLPFQQTETLLPGTTFGLETGTFTCTVSGTYVFTFSVLKADGNALWVHLRKNEGWVVSGRSGDSGSAQQVSGSAVLVLQGGDTVYLTMSGKAESYSSHHYTSFSGFLLYA